jgi:hypothetical protein
MNANDLRPGLYILTRDVVNPLTDKRFKHSWLLQSMWKAGTIFNVRPDADFGYGVKPAHDSHYQELYPPGPRSSDDRRAQFSALVDALQPKQDLSLEEQFCAEGHGWGNLHSPVLDELIRAGKVTATDCLEALRAYLARPEA